MTSDDVYKIILYAAAKNKQNGYVSPEDFNTVLMPVAQKSYLDYLLGEYQKYQPMRPISVVEFGQNERIRTSLAPLIYGAILNPFPYNGISPFPSDFEYTDNMWGLYGFYNIRFVQQNRLDSYAHSTIDPVVSNPVYLIQHEGFHFFPEDIGAAKLSYVRTPPPIEWAYTLDVNNRAIYDSVNSKQPIWYEADILDIVSRALRIIGVNLQSQAITQYAEEIKNTGQ